MYTTKTEVSIPLAPPSRQSPAVMDLMVLLGGYRLCAQAEGKSEKTVAIMTTAITLFVEFLRGEGLSTDVSEIGASELRAFIRHLQERSKYPRHPFNRPEEKKLSPFTTNGYVRAIRAFWSWLLAEEQIGRAHV